MKVMLQALAVLFAALTVSTICQHDAVTWAASLVAIIVIGVLTHEHQ